MNFESTISSFNDKIKSLTDIESVLRFARKEIIHGTPHVFKNKENEYFDFRDRIANKYNIGYYEVYIVGSAKLGFSYCKKTEFSLDSDIDVALVNEDLFNFYMYKVSELQYKIDNYSIWLKDEEYKKYNKFLKYIIKGWMRPDLLPASYGINVLKKSWFKFFKELSYGKSEVGDYKVNAGLYKNYGFLEKYCVSSINAYRIKISTKIEV